MSNSRGVSKTLVFERPLVTLVREFELPEQGADVRISIDPGSVLVFPAEETSTMDGNLSGAPSEVVKNQHLGLGGRGRARLARRFPFCDSA